MPPKKRIKAVCLSRSSKSEPLQSKRAADELEEKDAEFEDVEEAEDDSKETKAVFSFRVVIFNNLKATNAPGSAFKEKDGTRGWELGNKRRLTLSKFKGRRLVDIREFYEKDGNVYLFLGFG